MKKKVLSIMMAAAMILGLAACGGSASSTANTEAPQASTETTEQSADAAEVVEYKVGIVNYVDDASLNQIISNLEDVLDEQAAALGVKFNYADYYDNAQADATVLNQIGANLVNDEVDIIVAVATPTALVMMSATEDVDIPIVFAAVSDPVGAGIVETMDVPGGKVTGTSDGLDANALINLILATNNETKKIGLLYDTAQDSSTLAINQAKEILSGLNIEVVEKTGSTTDDVLLAAQALVDENVDAVFTPTDNTIMAAEQAIFEVFADAGIPHFAGADSFALWGAFCGYGVNYADLGRKTGEMVVDILVNGADPATTPVATFENGNVSVNIETCAALGLDLETIKEAYSSIATEFIELTTQQEFN